MCGNLYKSRCHRSTLKWQAKFSCIRHVNRIFVVYDAIRQNIWLLTRCLTVLKGNDFMSRNSNLNCWVQTRYWSLCTISASKVFASEVSLSNLQGTMWGCTKAEQQSQSAILLLMWRCLSWTLSSDLCLWACQASWWSVLVNLPGATSNVLTSQLRSLSHVPLVRASMARCIAQVRCFLEHELIFYFKAA